MHKKRPINLALHTLSFPPMAIASILHRLSGLLLLVLLPFILYLLHQSLLSASSFHEVKAHLSMLHAKFVLWLFLSAFIYHFFAGLRHMLMDLGFAESLNAGRISAWTVMSLAAIFIVLAGVWIC